MAYTFLWSISSLWCAALPHMEKVPLSGLSIDSKVLTDNRGEISGQWDDPMALAQPDSDDGGVSIVCQAPPYSPCQGIKDEALD